jgi:hypothetical protein
MAELFERGWLVGDERLSVTETERKHLRRRIGRTRGEVHRLSTGQAVRGLGTAGAGDIGKRMTN